MVMCTFADACIKILNVLLESASHLTSKGIGPHACTLQWPLSCGQLTLRVVKTPKLVIYTSGYIQSTYSLHWFLAELLKSLLSASAFTATATVSLCCSGWGCCSLWQFLESGNYKSSLQSPCLHHAHALRTIFGAFFFFFFWNGNPLISSDTDWCLGDISRNQPWGTIWGLFLWLIANIQKWDLKNSIPSKKKEHTAFPDVNSYNVILQLYVFSCKLPKPSVVWFFF